MSKIQERIKEIDKIAKRSRLIAIILSVIIIGFIVVTGWNMATISKKNAELEAFAIRDSIQKVDLKKTNDNLIISDSILKYKNGKLLELRGSIENFWKEADLSGKIKDYASYLERAIEDDIHYSEALEKMNTLANDTGYVQITDSDGTKYLKEIENLNTDDVFYRVVKAMRVRYGVLGHPDFNNRNTSPIGPVINIGDVVKIIKKYDFNSGAEWAEIRYDR